MLRGQPQEGAIEGVSIVDRDRWVGADRPLERQRLCARDPSPTAPMLLVTGIHEQPAEPGREALCIPEPRELAPREEECLLDSILSTLDIAKDPIRDRVAQVTVQVDQLREGDLVTIARLLDQPRPHERDSSDARMGASPTTDGGTLPPVQHLVGRLAPA